jgi:tripartite-type tricarboxylate transporter receptor subunit TctC
MNFARRAVLHLLVGAGALSRGARFAHAQAYPTRPVRLVVGFAPGGATDIVARLVGQWLSERLGQQIVVENRTGGGSNIAAQAVISAPADGYTVLMVTGSNAVNATFYDTLPFNFLRDIAPVAGLVRYPLVMVVNPSVPARNVREYIDYAKALNGKATIASYGTGTTGHLASELFKTMAGIKAIHIPYRGEALAMTDMIGGQVQMMLATSSGVAEHVKASRLRALAVTTATRWEQFPDLPTVADTVPGFEAVSWSGLGVPRQTQPQIIERLSREVNAALTDPGFVARLTEVSVAPLVAGPAAFGKLVEDETEKWGRVVRLSGAKPD